MLSLASLPLSDISSQQKRWKEKKNNEQLIECKIYIIGLVLFEILNFHIERKPILNNIHCANLQAFETLNLKNNFPRIMVGI